MAMIERIDPDLGPSEPRRGDCNATDGWAVCTNAPGHDGHVHWDRRLQHEFCDDDHQFCKCAGHSGAGRSQPPRLA
jgi:hypothetical protein